LGKAPFLWKSRLTSGPDIDCYYFSENLHSASHTIQKTKNIGNLTNTEANRVTNPSSPVSCFALRVSFFVFVNEVYAVLMLRGTQGLSTITLHVQEVTH
jgi:hypothetical protein